jgi:oxygen-dependent protoporphyrinogen oxidase
MPRVVIVGGGISGLALAYRLQQRHPDPEILVLEKNPRPGGTIATVARDGFRVECGPNGFLDNKPATLELCRDLGLGEQLLPASDAAGRNRFLLVAGRLHRLPTGLLAFLRSDVLSWSGKLLLLAERFRPRRCRSGDETIDSFARRRFGREAARTLADAFVTGIYAGDPRLLSIEATFPRLVGFERDHGSVMRGMAHARHQRAASDAPAGSRGGRMWSFAEGMAVLPDALALALRYAPRTGVAVRRVRRAADGQGWQVSDAENETWLADAVALTCPAYRQAELLADVDPELAECIDGIAYNRLAVVAVGYRRRDVPHVLDGFGHLSPQRERRDVLGVQWCSSIYPGHRAPPGAVLLRAMCGGWNRPEMADWPDDRLLGAVRSELALTLGVRAPPVFRHVIRWPRAIPQYHLGHLDRLARIEQHLAAHPGLFLGGNAYRGVALNDCVEQAGLLAERIHAWLVSAITPGI